MDTDSMTILQTTELRTDLQLFQRELHRMATDLEVMKSRVSMLWAALMVSVALNLVSIAISLYLLIKFSAAN